MPRKIVFLALVLLRPHTMTTAQAAAALGVHETRVLQLIAAGQLQAEKPGRDWDITDESVRARLAAPRPAGRPKSAGQSRAPATQPATVAGR